MGNKLLYHSQIKSQQGFTITEILVVVALSSVMMLANVSFLNEFMKNMHKVENESYDEAEMAIVNRRFATILAKMSSTFNRVSVTDTSGKNFFDFYPDMPRNAFGAAGSREYNLSASGADKQSIYFLMTEEDKFPGISMDPVHAYDEEVPAPSDLNLDGQVTYKGLNSVPAIGATKKLMTQVFGARWATNELFVLSSPVYLRPVANNGQVNLMTVPRMPSFVGRVYNDDLVPVTSTAFTILNSHPVTGVAYSGPDNYLRTLPPVGGASPFVKIEPVRLVRLDYRASTRYPPGYGDLFLTRWIGGQFADEELVIRKCKRVRLKRETVTMPLITVEIER
ncbi:MAG: prepilin-type N-terminal cleavage/methylation domain-containing protein [Bdellovibrionaceae bacterium]|nr:prepilin-type N-terminal cleavage/methylation domain-containing protein [Pseudobdellovibrionaceae bacterium]